jgi:hypothetical protein
MTFERKTVVGLDDIVAISFECKQCRTRVTMSPDNLRIPPRCQLCDCEWISGVPSNYAATTSAHANFVNAIKQIRKQLENGAPFRILLEFNAQERPW